MSAWLLSSPIICSRIIRLVSRAPRRSALTLISLVSGGHLMRLALLPAHHQGRVVPQPPGRSERRRSWWSWLLNPEVLVLLLLAAALRLYFLNHTEFDDDQATLFRMAYDAVHQGLLPVTSNTGSIGSQHP